MEEAATVFLELLVSFVSCHKQKGNIKYSWLPYLIDTYFHGSVFVFVKYERHSSSATSNKDKLLNK